MNEFSSMQNSGLLKPSYDDDATYEALKKRREKMAATKLGLIKDDDDADPSMGG